MSDDLTDEDSAVVRQLEALSPLFLKGWAKRHPMPARDRDLIEQAFGQARTAPGGPKPASAGPAGSAGQKSASKAKAEQPELPDQHHDRGH